MRLGNSRGELWIHAGMLQQAMDGLDEALNSAGWTKYHLHSMNER